MWSSQLLVQGNYTQFVGFNLWILCTLFISSVLHNISVMLTCACIHRAAFKAIFMKRTCVLMKNVEERIAILSRHSNHTDLISHLIRCNELTTNWNPFQLSYCHAVSNSYLWCCLCHRISWCAVAGMKTAWCYPLKELPRKPVGKILKRCLASLAQW